MPEWIGRHQVALLIESGALGVCLGFVFDCFNVLSKMRRRNRLPVFLGDVAFFVLAALVTFFFSLAVMDGRMHPLLFFGIAIGMIVQHLTIGRLFSRALYLLLRFLYRVFRTVLSWITIPFRLAMTAIFRVFSLLREKIGKSVKKAQKKSRFFQKNS